MRKLIFLFIIINSFVFTQWVQNERAPKTTAGNLVMENVPSIPVEIKEKSRRYSKIRSASFRSWTQDGKEMLIATRFGETTQLHKINQPLGQRKQITFYDEPVGGGYFSKDKTKNGFLFSKDTGGNEYWQVYYYDFNQGKETLLTDGKTRNSIGGWSNNGKLFAFSSNKENGVDMNIFISDLKGNEKQLFSEKGSWSAIDWSVDDKRILVRRYISINESYMHF